jgi:hypothetical protein
LEVIKPDLSGKAVALELTIRRKKSHCWPAMAWKEV